MTPAQLQVLKEAALAGEITSKLMYGLALVQGKFAAQDTPQGLGFIRAAAEGGHPEAMFFMAVYQLDQVEHTPENLEIARILLEKAAFTGHAKSQVELAKSYLAGNFWKASDEQALMWLRFAVKENQTAAFLLLGFYFLDRGFSQEAVRWMRVAEKAGYPQADLVINETLEKLTAEGFKEDFQGHAIKIASQTLGRGVMHVDDLLEELKSSGTAAAWKTISVMYDYGYGVPLNPILACEALKKSGEKGDSEAMWYYGQKLRIGYLGDEARKTAGEWLNRAEASGYDSGLN